MGIVIDGYKILSEKNIYFPKARSFQRVVTSNEDIGASQGDNTTLSFVAGEAIIAGQGVFIADDGLIYNAHYSVVEGKPCDAIAITSGLTGADIVCAMQNGTIISNSDYFFTVGDMVYLYFGEPNITTGVVSSKGLYRQALGKAVSVNSFSLNMDNAAMEIFY